MGGNTDEVKDAVEVTPSEVVSVSQEVLEVDDVDFGMEFEEVSQGVLYDEITGDVFIDDETFDGIVESDGFYTLDTGKLDKSGKPVVKRVKPKRVKRKKNDKITIGLLKDENYGDMLPFIKDINVTDIDWNGSQLWITDIMRGRYCSDVVLTDEFVSGFVLRVANVVSRSFNKYTPELEAETDELRITVLHNSVAHTGVAISIRKTPAVKRINFAESIKNGDYCTEEVANIMSNSVKAKFNVVVCGLPGVGKTELAKFLTNYIFKRDRVITIEDTLEVHYSKINPGKDCLEMKVSDNFSYTDAIKASLRLSPQWVLLSEARSTEVKYLLESVSTGTKCITTLHTDDVRKVPDRVVNMIGNVAEGGVSIINSIYSFFDIAIMIDKKEDPVTGRITRWVSQLCFFDRDDGENKCYMIVDDGVMTGEELPDSILRRFRSAGIADPLKYTFIKETRD